MANENVEIRPEWDRILVRPVEFEASGMLEVVNLSSEAPDKGEILALGPDVDSSRFSVGEIILWGKYSGIPMVNDRHLVRQGDVIAHVRGASLKGSHTFDALGNVVETK